MRPQSVFFCRWLTRPRTALASPSAALGTRHATDFGRSFGKKLADVPYFAVPYRVEKNAHKLPPLGWPKFSLTAAFLPRR